MGDERTQVEVQSAIGELVGETMRRATGQTISTLLREAVTIPLGVADEVHFGVPPRPLGLVARQVAPEEPPAVPEPRSPLDRALPPAILPHARYANRTDALTSDIPSDGTMTARGVARLYSALLGDVDGVALVSSPRLVEMACLAFSGIDEVMGFPSSWPFGYSPRRRDRQRPPVMSARAARTRAEGDQPGRQPARDSDDRLQRLGARAGCRGRGRCHPGHRRPAAAAPCRRVGGGGAGAGSTRRATGPFIMAPGTALVFAVAPVKVLAFGKGTFTHTSHRF